MAFAYRGGTLCAEQVALEDLARRFGTPCYVYSRAAIEGAYREFTDELSGRASLVCYSVKANSNLAVLSVLARLGAGFDIVSGGELARVIAAGGDPAKVVFSGVGKAEAEIRAALQAGVLSLNLESEQELERVNAIAAALGKRAPVAFRVNPDVDAKTHPYISTGLKQNKFGVAWPEAERLYRKAAALPNIRITGVGCHIGSLMLDSAPFVAATRRIVSLVERLEQAGIALDHIDLGGGMGIRYHDEASATIAAFVHGALDALGRRKETVLLDPGRAIVGNAGVLLTRVEYLKPGEAKNFLIVDAAMNDLIRPALYDAWHEVRPLREVESGAARGVYDIVGPVCESSDWLARDRLLAPRQGDFLAIMSAGAYAMVMSSNYNSRPRAAEIMVSGARAHLVRRRETPAGLFEGEQVPEWT
ncbi:MAG: diaminopimelate decarboxylase [Betaproteobacteria bacterium]|nr:diaminopimelate decarboxylase [Betaproteobacteria bacterium]